VEEAKRDGYFQLPLSYDNKTHLWKLPIYLGFHPEELKEPYWCAVDFSIPTVIVPSYLCMGCTGKKFKEPDQLERREEHEKLLYPHKMMYWKFSDGSFTVREE